MVSSAIEPSRDFSCPGSGDVYPQTCCFSLVRGVFNVKSIELKPRIHLLALTARGGGLTDRQGGERSNWSHIRLGPVAFEVLPQ